MTQRAKFKADVDAGLSRSEKTLSSKYFYDQRGSELFVQIMHLPEYYLTRAELNIFKNKSVEMIDMFGIKKQEYVELIELGSGDGTKTKELLSVMDAHGYQFRYFPIDISLSSLQQLEATLAQHLPQLKVTTQHGDYFDILHLLKHRKHKKIVFFLGSNLGNQYDDQAAEFIYQLGANLHPQDLLVLGLDLIKAAEQVLPAYNDKQGLTRAFNLNLLSRINRELGANFDLTKFMHAPEYSQQTGIAISYLKSLIDQTVFVGATQKVYDFKRGEKIRMEISRKYSDEILASLIEHTDFALVGKLLDDDEVFADYILRRDL